MLFFHEEILVLVFEVGDFLENLEFVDFPKDFPIAHEPSLSSETSFAAERWLVWLSGLQASTASATGPGEP